MHQIGIVAGANWYHAPQRLCISKILNADCYGLQNLVQQARKQGVEMDQTDQILNPGIQK